MCTKQSRLLVHITDGTEVTAYNFAICILANIVFGHLEHPKMEISDWAKRPACYENDGLLLWVAKDWRKTM
jgi:hypothetical protein